MDITAFTGEILDLAEAQCTDEEIAAKTGISLEELKTLAETIERSRDAGKAKLRKVLFDRAIGGVDFYGSKIEATKEVAVWLSKQYLKMADKVQEDKNLNIRVVRADWDAEGEIVEREVKRVTGGGDTATAQVPRKALPEAGSESTGKRDKKTDNRLAPKGRKR